MKGMGSQKRTELSCYIMKVGEWGQNKRQMGEEDKRREPGGYNDFPSSLNTTEGR